MTECPHCGVISGGLSGALCDCEIEEQFPGWQRAKPRHPDSVRFHEILREMAVLHDKKQRDYGSNEDPFANVQASTEWGVPAWQGAMIRACDKVKRLQTFADKGELANESVVDAFNDLAVYAVIARVLYEREDSDDIFGGLTP